MERLIEEIFNANADILAFMPGGKESWIAKIKDSYELLGDTIRNTKTNAATTRTEFESVVLSFARAFLMVRNTGKYIPDLIDQRSDSARAEHAKEVEKVVMDLFKRMQIVFSKEHLGQTDLRKTLAAEIAQRFLYEGQGQEGEMVFRKVLNGWFGPPLEPADLIMKLVSPYIDQARTRKQQTENRLTLEEVARKRLGFPDRLTERQSLILRDEVELMTKENLRSYTLKRLPSQSQVDLNNEFEKQALFQIGVTDPKLLTLPEMRQKRAYVSGKMDMLKEIEPLKTKMPGDIYESWPGMDTTKNKSGMHLNPSQF